MPHLQLGPARSLFYRYEPPASRRHTFVFLNALTGNTGAWETEIGPLLRAAGFGTLAYNMRGQADSPFAPHDVLDENLIVADLKRLVREIAPPAPILAGLSIGGLFAARAILSGMPAEGLVLMNTLRKPGLGLAWINEAMARAARTGGTQLVMDMFLPMLVGADTLAKLRPNCLGEAPYQPLPETAGAMQLLGHGRTADWDVPYEKLRLPVLVMSGLADRVFYHAGDVAELMARLPDAREVRLETVGHLVPLEAGAETACHLIAFADHLEGKARA